MGIRMVRQPSETPNVTNIDDIIPFRYAYGNQDGYVIGKGTEVSYTIDGNTFRVNSGRVVLQGVETDIDANGVSFTIDNSSEKRYFVVYYEVNLATQTTAIKLSTYSTSGYPTIDAGDDLTANSSGIARLPLYRFTVTSGVIDNSSPEFQKLVKGVSYYNGQLLSDLVVENYGNGGFSISEDYDELISANIGDVLKFNIASPNGSYINAFTITDVIEIKVVSSLNIWKRLSTCSLLPGSVENVEDIERYINIKYENGQIYIKGFTYHRGTQQKTVPNCYIISIYKVSEV